jgi:hypothetical protein
MSYDPPGYPPQQPPVVSGPPAQPYGAPLSGYSQPPPKKKSKAWVWVLAGVGVLFGLCLFGTAVNTLKGNTPVASSTDVTTADGAAATVDPTTEPPTVAPTTKAAPPVVKHTTKAPTTKPVSVEEQNAIRSAQSYLAFSAFSRKGLIRQLSSDAGEGYSVKAATYAVDSLHINFNEQAYKSAESYLEMSGFSRKRLIEQLESDAGEGFTHSQAVYGVKKAGL